MDHFLKLNAVLLLVVMLSGCVSLTQSEKNAVYELKSYGVNTCNVKIKNPAVAAWLCLLPFAGYGYLAYGSDEKYLWNIMWLTWFWSIPAAYSDAVVLNKKELVRYYQYMPAGQEELKALRKKYRTVELGLNEIDYNDGRVRVS
ncbi:MAG: hypothetical protein ABH891_00360 [Candidatus Omnitrophota bacterium]